MDTITAIATGTQRTALGVIRLSGPDAIRIASKVFRPVNGGELARYPAHRLILGSVEDENGAVLDQVLCTYSRAPRSFTGEDTAELQGHGSPAAMRVILRRLLRMGARQAGPGEFSRRAFLNGRLDLTQAEAIMDIIDAESPLAVRNAAGQLRGSISRRIGQVYEELLALQAHFQAVVDYPEEGVEPLEAQELAETLRRSDSALRRLLRSYERGQLLRDGVRCAILGRPNAGKSSLLNALLGEERAIVTDEAGTTRDTLEERLELGDLPLRLIDTAGLRETDSLAEAEGVRRAKLAAVDAQLVLAVFDGSRELGAEDESVMDAAAQAPCRIAVVNKCDLPRVWELNRLQGFSAVCTVSAATGSGLEELERTVTELLSGSEAAETGEILTNARQYDAILRASGAVTRAADALELGFTPDAVLTDTEDALLALGEVTGQSLREDLVEAVFSRFCVGK